MKTSEPLIVAIKDAYRNHPIIGGNNVKIAEWEDKELINKHDIFLPRNILQQQRHNNDNNDNNNNNNDINVKSQAKVLHLLLSGVRGSCFPTGLITDVTAAGAVAPH